MTLQIQTDEQFGLLNHGPDQIIASTQDFEYELTESDSLTFLHNLIFDRGSQLSRGEILTILNSFKKRKESLSFKLSSGDPADCDDQGVDWCGLYEKFQAERDRKKQGYTNVKGSKIRAKNDVNLSISNKSRLFSFKNFYSKARPSLIHFQLRNLISTSNKSSIFYLEASDMNYLELSGFKIRRLDPELNKIETIIDSSNLSYNYNRISTLTSSNKYVLVGCFEGIYYVHDISTNTTSKQTLTANEDGITNHIHINEMSNELNFSSNDKFLRVVDFNNFRVKQESRLPFAINCLAMSQQHPNEKLIVGDDTRGYIIDARTNTTFVDSLPGHSDYGFACDWYGNTMVTGNQDCTVRVWDRRYASKSLACWKSNHGNAIRNIKISNSGKYLAWGESLDNIGLVDLADLTNRFIGKDEMIARPRHNGGESKVSFPGQSIDVIGKITGLSFLDYEGGLGEELVIGVNDSALGGILSYCVESSSKCLDFDFY